MALILSGSLAVGTAAADEPTTTEPAPPTTTSTKSTQPPPTSETPPPGESSPPPPTSADPAPPAPPSSTKPEPTTTTTPPADPSGAPAPAPAPPSSGSAGPASARDGLADLKVSAAFTEPTYKAGDSATMRVTINNTGSVAAEGVRASGGGDLDVRSAWGPLGTKPGVRVEPNTDWTTELTGRVLKTDNGKVTFSVKVTADTGDANPADNATFVEVPLTQATGVFGGAIVADIDDNGTIDPGEGLGGVTITLSGHGQEARTKTTDAQGRFEFPDLPVGNYFVDYRTASFPWVVPGLSGNGFDSLTIDDSGKYANVTITAIRSLFNTLRVTMKFDKSNYAPEDTAKVTVTLRNTSARPLAGVVAQCSHRQDGPELVGTGSGWGDLAAGAQGVTVPANGVKTVQVTEAVPAASPRYGYVSVACSFGPANYPLQARVFGNATATVLGVHATGVGVVAEDLNHNFQVDPGEERSGVTVRVADQDTGVILGEARTDGSGRFAVENLQAGAYELRIDDPWKWQNSFVVFSVVADTPPRVQELFVEPRHGQEGKLANLRVTAEFDKQAYESGDLVHVKMTVANVGEADADEVRIFHESFSDPTSLVVDEASLGDLGAFGGGGHIAAGATRVVDVTGTVRAPDSGVVTLSGQAFLKGNDRYLPNNVFDIEASVTVTTGDYAGRIYADTNGNGKFDDGEGLGGILIRVSGGVPRKSTDQATKPDGSFAFSALNTGQYFVGFEDPTGRWVPLGESGNGFDSFQLDKAGHVGVLIKAIPPLSDSLVPTLVFTKDSYAEGESAHLTVTLVNKGTVDLTGVKATCGSEAPNGLIGGPGWGALDKAAEGVTVPAGTTRIFDVSEKVPVGSRDAGEVFAACSFGAQGHPAAGHPVVLARARVPGAIGSGSGRLTQTLKGDGSESPRAGNPIPDTKVVLLDGFTHLPVAKTRTDSDGKFSFSGLPAGQYELVVVGPWKFFDEFGQFFYVSGSGSDNGDILLVPGPEKADPFPDTQQPVPGEPASPAAPQPQGSVVPASAGLASTGANVTGLTVLSMVLLLLGVGVVLAGRRKQAS
ncbi:SdrD B-like domain-containing protein [Actinocrispum wychmicini]|nr:SdrD B-like domain-containing protein [Actinocrispum wychmicini]